MNQRRESVEPEPGKPPFGPPPRLTRTELGVWAIYGVLAVLLVAVPLLTRSFSLEVVGAWVLLVGAAAMSLGWLRNGELRTAEWLSEEEYSRFLRELQGPYEPGPGPD